MLARTCSLLVLLAACQGAPRSAPHVVIARVQRHPTFPLCANVGGDVIEVCASVDGEADVCASPTVSPVCLDVICPDFDRKFVATVRVRDSLGQVAQDVRTMICRTRADETFL